MNSDQWQPTDPIWKVYQDGEWVASCNHPEHAAMLTKALGEGSTVRYDHPVRNTVWTAGAESVSVADSDAVVMVMIRRKNALLAAKYGH